MSVKIEQISTNQLDLGEGPHWDAKTRKLYFVDILCNSIHQYDPESNKHTWARVDKSVSIIIPVTNEVNKFVITYGCDLATIRWDGDSKTVSDLKILATACDQYPDVRINDGKCSPSGVLFAGTMSTNIEVPENIQSCCHLYAVKGNVFKTLLSGVKISNGLAWSQDETTFYYNDSLLFRVDAFDYDRTNLTLSNRRTVFDFTANNIDGFPDGMTIDSDGNLWVAVFAGSQVLKINPTTGTLLDAIKIPAMYVTSAAFGGPNLEDLYVTTSRKASEIHLENEPAAGTVFKVTGTGSRGLPGVAINL